MSRPEAATRSKHLPAEAEIMKVTVETIDEANRLMAEIAANEMLGDGDRLAKMAQVWAPITDSADATILPPSMQPLFRQLDADFVGAIQDGRLIAWGPKRAMPGTEKTWRELIVIQSNRRARGD
jgi:hypothetical protein